MTQDTLKVSKKGNRTKLVKLFLSPEEHQVLKECAEWESLPMRALVRQVLFRHLRLLYEHRKKMKASGVDPFQLQQAWETIAKASRSE